MKIKSNVRAGAGGGNNNNNNNNNKVGGHSSQVNNTFSFYIPPISRCVGI